MKRFFQWLKGGSDAPRVVVTKTHAVSPKAAQALIEIARQKVVAEPLAKIAVLPAQWLDRWPLWERLNLHVPMANGYDASEVFSLRGSCLKDLGFYFDALEDYNKAIQKQPSQAIANNYFIRSMIKESLFDFEGSAADLKEAIRLSKLDNDDNRFWNSHAKSIGFDSQTEFYEWDFPTEEMILFKKRTYTDERIADELKKIKRRR